MNRHLEINFWIKSTMQGYFDLVKLETEDSHILFCSNLPKVYRGLKQLLNLGRKEGFDLYENIVTEDDKVAVQVAFWFDDDDLNNETDLLKVKDQIIEYYQHHFLNWVNNPNRFKNRYGIYRIETKLK